MKRWREIVLRVGSLGESAVGFSSRDVHETYWREQGISYRFGNDNVLYHSLLGSASGERFLGPLSGMGGFRRVGLAYFVGNTKRTRIARKAD